MSDCDYTAADLAVIRRAIATGELRVDFADRSTTYRSITELMVAEAHITRQLATTPRSKQSFGRSSKDLG